MPKQTTRPEDQHNVFARQEPMHTFQCVRSARTDAQLPMCSLGKNRCTTPRKNEVETPGMREKTIGGRVGPGRQAKYTQTVTETQTFIKQNGRNTSNDTSLTARLPGICFLYPIKACLHCFSSALLVSC